VDLIRRDLPRAVPEGGQPAAIVLSFLRLLGCKLRQRRDLDREALSPFHLVEPGTATSIATRHPVSTDAYRRARSVARYLFLMYPEVGFLLK
jgi:hypothetical protein